MAQIRELFQSGDWKTEKHVPVVETPETLKRGEVFEIKVSVGKEVPHPNTTDHHIGWIDVYFLGDGNKFPFQIAHVEFLAHGASPLWPNTSTIYTSPEMKVHLKTEKPGVIYAVSYCNIHGLWENSKEIKFI